MNEGWFNRDEHTSSVLRKRFRACGSLVPIIEGPGQAEFRSRVSVVGGVLAGMGIVLVLVLAAGFMVGSRQHDNEAGGAGAATRASGRVSGTRVLPPADRGAGGEIEGEGRGDPAWSSATEP